MHTVSQASINRSKGTTLIPSPQSNPEHEPIVGPQATCSPTSGNLGTPYGAYFPGQDLSTVSWSLDSDCTMHLSGGTTSTVLYTYGPWSNAIRTSIRAVSIEGNLTITGSDMFRECSNMSSFKVAPGYKVYLARNSGNTMFYQCRSLTSLDLSSFNTSYTDVMANMFRECSHLTSLDLSSFDTSKVNNSAFMFFGCYELTSLDLSSFDTRSNGVMSQMFSYCSKLRAVALGPNASFHETTNGSWPDFLNGVSVSTWVKVNALVSDPWDYTLANPQWSGTTSQLQTRAAGSNPAGVYVDQKLLPTGVRLIAYANGGSMPANWTTHVDTSLSAQTLTMPATAITDNKPGSLLSGWNTSPYGYGTSYTPNQQLTIGQGNSYPARTITVYAQWKTLNAPSITTPPVHVPATGDPTVGMSAKVTDHLVGDKLHLWVTTGSQWDATHTYTTGESDTYTWQDAYPSQLRSDWADQYDLKATLTRQDPATGRDVTSGTAELKGILPYASIKFDANGGTGAPTGTLSGLADSSDNLSRITIPTGTIPSKGAKDVFAGWSPSATATSADTSYNPGSRAPGIASSHTTTLYAVWHHVNTPTNLNFTRDPATNHITLSGDSQPWAANDIITACYTPTTGGTPTCQGPASTSATDASGSPLPYDGATSHHWTITIPTPDDHALDNGGQWNLTATLTAQDPWRVPAGSTITSDQAQNGPIRLAGLYAHNLPLTGGQPQHLATLLAGGLGAALILLAAASSLRNQRRKNARHSR